MDTIQIKEALGWFGDKSSLATQWVIQKLSSFGLQISQTQSKILNLVLVLGALYLIFKIIEIPKRVVKWGLIISLVVLGVSTFMSFL